MDGHTVSGRRHCLLACVTLVRERALLGGKKLSWHGDGHDGRLELTTTCLAVKVEQTSRDLSSLHSTAPLGAWLPHRSWLLLGQFDPPGGTGSGQGGQFPALPVSGGAGMQ